MFFPELSVLQAFYGPLGLALFLLPFTRSMRDHLKAVGTAQPISVGRDE